MSRKTLVVVTGSRDWRGQKCSEIMKRELEVFDGASTILLHGNQSGADQMANGFAHHFDWRASIPVPYLGVVLDLELGKRGGPARNQVMEYIARAMVKNEDGMLVRLLAFPMIGSRGTWDCVKRFKGWADVKIIQDMLQQERSHDV